MRTCETWVTISDIAFLSASSETLPWVSWLNLSGCQTLKASLKCFRLSASSADKMVPTISSEVEVKLKGKSRRAMASLDLNNFLNLNRYKSFLIVVSLFSGGFSFNVFLGASGSLASAAAAEAWGLTGLVFRRNSAKILSAQSLYVSSEKSLVS